MISKIVQFQDNDTVKGMIFLPFCKEAKRVLLIFKMSLMGNRSM